MALEAWFVGMIAKQHVLHWHRLLLPGLSHKSRRALQCDTERLESNQRADPHSS